jgi:serine/threonine protein phosphatase PrpC
MGQDEHTRRSALSPILDARAFTPVSATVRVDIGARTICGKGRSYNEDQYLVMRLGREQEILTSSLSKGDLPRRFEEHGYAMLVADGLGEGGAGATAGRVALSTVAHMVLHYGRWNLRIDPRVAAEIFDRAEWYYAQADAAVRSHAASHPALKGMSASMTTAYSAGDDLFIAHVGHGRAYLYRHGELKRLTSDHTLEEHLSRTNRPTAVERRTEDLRHILTDAVGASSGYPLVEIEKFRLMHRDWLLLCTNGLTDMLTDDEIAHVLALPRRPDQQCESLAALAASKGGTDDITVICAEYLM